ncbi:putative acyltransferase [Pseudomonas sp. GM49]|uniref:acyltransferase family protein n=1 Tax=Pseudomonas sp. GM49 TaxID=1144331 RepID=UPI00026FE4F7|nr:acyltransferase [Pseudomonas sp. GM49]EJM62275.1 putative acyltransferase [Pseudomonas sp. GM49]
MSRMTQEQSSQLDSMRALAAIVVLFGHTFQTLLLPAVGSWFTLVVLVSQLAVMVFFVLSGFLIGKSVCNNISKNSVFNIGQYAKDRAIRIYPPLIASLVLMVVLSIVAPYVFPSGTNALLTIEGVDFVRTEYVSVSSDVLGALAFLNGFKTETPSANGPLWSLSIEVWYYVIAASVFLWPGRKIISSVMLGMAVFVTYKNSLFFMLAPVWFSGFGLALIHQRRPQMNNRIFGVMFAVSSLAFIAVVVFALFDDPSGNAVVLAPLNYFRVVSGLWFACFLALLMGGGASFPKWFRRHAAYSYTLYVIHFPIMLFVLGLSQRYIYNSVPNALFVSAVTIVISLAASWLISRWVESKSFISGLALYAKKAITKKLTA